MIPTTAAVLVVIPMTEDRMDFVDFLLAMEHFNRDEQTFRVKKLYIDIAGELNAGILLGQIVYWYLPQKGTNRTKLRVFRKGQLWLAKKREDWWGEIRLTPRQYDWAVEKLLEKGLVETAIFHFAGAPTTHIRLQKEALEKAVKAQMESISQNCDMDITELQDGYNSTVTPYTDTTTKNTNRDDDPTVESEIAATVDNSSSSLNQSSSIRFAEKEKELTEEIRSYCDMSRLTEEELQKAAASLIEEYPDVPLVAQVRKWGEHFKLNQKPVTGRVLAKLQGWMKYYDPDQDTEKLEAEERREREQRDAEQVHRSCPWCDSGYIGQFSHKSPTQCNDCGRWWMLEDCEEVETPADMIPRKAYCPHCGEQN